MTLPQVGRSRQRCSGEIGKVPYLHTVLFSKMYVEIASSLDKSEKPRFSLLMKLPVLIAGALIAASVNARAQSDLDLQAAYCAGAFKQQFDTIAPGAAAGHYEDAVRLLNGKMQHLQRYFYSRGYYDSTSGAVISRLMPPVAQGKADQAEMLASGGRSPAYQCALRCNAGRTKQFDQCMVGCRDLQTPAERKVTACLQIEDKLPF